MDGECRTCHRLYMVPEGRSDPGFCSDRCFSETQTEEPSGSRVWKLALLVGLVALAVFRLEAASGLARNVPPAAPVACAFLAWNGGEGTERLLAMALESEPLRLPALAALQRADPADARPRLTARLDDLRKLL